MDNKMSNAPQATQVSPTPRLTNEERNSCISNIMNMIEETDFTHEEIIGVWAKLIDDDRLADSHYM